MAKMIIKLIPNTHLFKKLTESDAEKEILFALIWFFIVIPIFFVGLIIVALGIGFKQ